MPRKSFGRGAYLPPTRSRRTFLRETKPSAGSKSLLHVAPEQLHLDQIVRILHRRAIRRISLGVALVQALETVGVEDQVPGPAQEIRRGQAHVGAERGARDGTAWIPVGENRADVGLLQQVPLDASDEGVPPRPDRRVTSAHVQHAEIGAAALARQLHPNVDGHLFSRKQPDLAAEKRDHFRSGRAEVWHSPDGGIGKSEDPGVLQKKRTLLRKEQGKTRQVDLASVHFCFAEVCVHRRGEFETGVDVVEHVEPRLAGDRTLSGGTDMQPAPP
jgi:hypothetical protein